MIHIRPFFTEQECTQALQKLGVYSEGITRMQPKAVHHCVMIPHVKNQAAAILKQDMLSLGGDVAVHGDVIRYKRGVHSCMIMGTEKQLWLLVEKMRQQPYQLAELSNELHGVLHAYQRTTWTLRIRKKKYELGCRTMIMGILNTTPDSFSDGGKYDTTDCAVQHALQMVEEGADIIDVGGESSRPYAQRVSLNEEIKRVIPVIKELRKRSNILISIDTYKSEVAQRALDAGADMINDISALRFDKNMARVAARAQVPVVLMHLQGTPRTMQKNPRYADVVADIISFLHERVVYARAAGINENALVLDPGIGFGKTAAHNCSILKHIRSFSSLGYPLLVGPSRKAFIGNITGAAVTERLAGTLASCALCTNARVAILRVHDVAAATQAVRVTEAIRDAH